MGQRLPLDKLTKLGAPTGDIDQVLAEIAEGRRTPFRVYSDAEMQRWLREDRVTPAERRRVLKKTRAR